MESIFISTLTTARAGQLRTELLNVKKGYQSLAFFSNQAISAYMKSIVGLFNSLK